MTNAEKFKEVFGTDIYPKNNPKEASCIFDIRNCIPGNTCEGCPYEDFWVKEYKEVNGMTDEQKEVVQSMTEDNINPDHYKNSTSLECIEAMQIIFGKEGVIYFCLCNAWKYIWRWKHKNGEEDLRKAGWYVKKGREVLANTSTYKSEMDQWFDGMEYYINSHLN